jgi:hypothetical protein
MKLTDILLEGKYDKLIGEISKKTFKVIKTMFSKIGTPENPKKYRGLDIFRPFTDWKKWTGERKGFSVGLFNDSKLLPFYAPFLEVELKFIIILGFPDEADVNFNGYYDTSFTDYPRITLEILANEAAYEKGEGFILRKIQEELRDLLRHEIEHITHIGDYSKPDKVNKLGLDLKKNINKVNKTYKDTSNITTFDYITLPTEIDANIQGLYSKAKTTKKPFQDVFDNWLNQMFYKNHLNEKELKKVYDIYKKRILKIGGIPKLK